MNHVLDMLEELMVKVEQHEITFIIFSVIALLYLEAILYLICCVHITRHDLRAAEERLTNGHNKLAAICSACPTHSVERNGTRPMVQADRYGRSAPVIGEKGQCLYSSTPSHPSPSRPSQQPRTSSPPAGSHSSPTLGPMPGFPGTPRR